MKIKWVLSHDPIELFKRSALTFADEVSRKSQGEIQVEVLTVTEYNTKYGENLNRYDIVDHMQAGKIEMSQTYSTDLGEACFDMYALDLPFLFRDHDHSSKVLDGEVGEFLLAGLKRNANIKGLAFTYSGGYRILPTTKELRKMEDFKGMELRVCRSPVAHDVFEAIGANPRPMRIEDLTPAVEAGRLEGGESTYPRIYSMNQNRFAKVINKTEHSLFLTTILMAGKFWDSLSTKHQEIIKSAAMTAAQIERQESIKDIELTEAKCQEDGIKINTLPKAEMEKFKAMTSRVYEQYENQFSPDLVKRIEETH